MIRHPGLAIAVSMGLVLGCALIGVGIGATAETCAGGVDLLTSGVLMLSVIGAICRGADDRPGLLSFAAFGWGYVAMAHWYAFHEGPLPTSAVIPGSVDRHGDLLSGPPTVRIAHDAWVLGIAFIGSWLTRQLFSNSAARAWVAEEPISPGTWWRKPVVLAVAGSGLVTIAALAAWHHDRASGAGTAFLLSWALLGVAVLGAVLTRGRRRAAWLGAASFGLGYMVLAFGPIGSPELPTNHLVNAILRSDGPRPGIDRDEGLSDDDASQRLTQALDEPVSLHFSKNTPLTVVLGPIKDALRRSVGKEPVVYADLELRLPPKELDRRLVTIDRDDIPAKEALRLCLGQLGLRYRVQSGYLRIVPNALRPVPYEEDPVMVAAHSLLALIAAVIGGATAPLVARLTGPHVTGSGA